MSDPSVNHIRDAVSAAMEAQGLKPTARAEELTVEAWIALSNACEE